MNKPVYRKPITATERAVGLVRTGYYKPCVAPLELERNGGNYYKHSAPLELNADQAPLLPLE